MGNEYVYIMKEKRIIFYNKCLEEICYEHSVSDGRSPEKMKCQEDTLAVLTRDGRQNYLEVLIDKEVVESTAAKSSVFCVGRSGEVVYESETGLAIWNGGKTLEVEGPPEGQITALALTDSHLVAMIGHRVSEGGGFTVYRRPRPVSSGVWVPVHCAQNRSPLATVHGALATSGQRLLIRELSMSGHWTTGRQTLLHDTTDATRTELGTRGFLSGPCLAIFNPSEKRLVVEDLSTGQTFSEEPISGEPLDVLCRSPSWSVVAYNDGSLRCYRHSRITYTVSLGTPLTGARFASDSALLWNKDTLFTLTLKDPDDHQFPSDLLITSAI